jgi:hypothetical protein
VADGAGVLEDRWRPGWIRADLAGLHRAGAALALTATELADRGRQVLALTRDPRLPVVVAPAVPEFGLMGVATELAEVTSGPHGLIAIATRSQALAIGVGQVADAYGAVDLPWPLKVWSPLPELVPTHLQIEMASRLAEFAGLIGARVTGEPWLADASRLDVGVRAGPCDRPATGPAELLGRIEAPGPSRAGRPWVHVERIDEPAGRHWVVSLPGTAAWSLKAGRTPFDFTGDVRLMAGQASAAMAGVVRALSVIGVRPGEPVLLVGHSQGGLIAAALAADRQVQRKFTITHVLTAGAPIGAIRIPDRIQVLSLEHIDDLVPELDGVRNPVRPSWTTIRTRTPTEPNSQRLTAHRLESYRQTAAELERSGVKSIAVWKRSAQGFLSGPGQSCADWDIELARDQR